VTCVRKFAVSRHLSLRKAKRRRKPRFNILFPSEYLTSEEENIRKFDDNNRVYNCSSR
jgi:hypothetical protein